MRAALYTRISEDRDGNRLGVTRQRDDCEALAAQLGYEITARFDDNDVSATSGQRRRGFEALLAAMTDGVIDAVICWHPDRLYRSLRDLVRLLDATRPHDIQIRTVNAGALDLSTATGRMVATILGSVATAEVEHKAERQRAAALQKAQRGNPNWDAAFGYLPSPNGPQPDPDIAPLIRQAYAAILAGGSLADVCRLFNNAQAFTLTGKRWDQATVSRFLRRPFPAGLRAYKGEIVGKASWTPIVDESTWRAAQTVLNDPARQPGRKSVRKHLLTGMLRCGACGWYLSGAYLYPHTRKIDARPRTRKLTYSCKGCRGLSIRAEHVQPLLYALVSGRLAMPDAVDLLKAEQDQAEVEALRAEANTLAARLDQLAVDYANGLLTAKQVRTATDILNTKLAEITARQHDSERLRVFDGLPLGSAEVAQAVEALSPDRFRAVLDVLAAITVMPVGKGSKVFHPERVHVTWR